MVALKVDLKNFEPVIKEMSKMADKKTMNTIIIRSANDAAKSGAAESRRQIREEYTLPLSELKIRVKPYLSVRELCAGIKMNGTPIPLAEFKYTPKIPSYQNPAPIKVEIKKGQKTILGKNSSSGISPFIAIMKSGKMGIFRRKTEKRLPIESFPGPSVAGLINANEDVQNKILDYTLQKFEERLNHHFDHLVLNS